MAEEPREGYYKDRYGRWQQDRRTSNDRRGGKASGYPLAHERRRVYRRKIDRERFERDHRQHIKEALNEFAAEHNGHL